MYTMNNKEDRVFTYHRSSYIDEESYKYEVNTCINGLLREMKNTLHLNIADMSGDNALKYLVRRNGFKPYEDIGREGYNYTMHGILVLIEDRQPRKTILTVPYKSPDYTKSIGQVGDINYIPSTIDFINSFNPATGYKK